MDLPSGSKQFFTKLDSNTSIHGTNDSITKRNLGLGRQGQFSKDRTIYTL